MNKRYLWILLTLVGFSAAAQVAISDQVGPIVPDSSAILDLQSSDKGFLMPRLSQAQRDGIAAPSIGLQVYNLSSNCVDVYFPTGWRSIYCDCSNPPSNQIAYPGTIRQFDNVLFSPTANFPGFVYSWTFQDGTPASSVMPTPTITWSGTGDKVITFSVTDTNNCPNSLTDTISVLPCLKPNSAFSYTDTVGLNQVSNFSANGAGLTYAWTFPSGSPASSSSQNQNVSWSAAGNYNVQLITTSATGCKDTTINTITVVNCSSGDSAVFLTCGITGKDGPTQTDCNNTYGGNPTVTVNGGIQEWTVPAGICGPFTIKAWGAQGGGPQGGLGAYTEGTFTFNPGDVIRILVGQRGQQNGNGTGGGGGTFVMQTTGGSRSGDVVLLISGGGGGSSSSTFANRNASAGQNGLASQGGQAGGTGGNGGAASGGDGGSGGGGRSGNGIPYTGGSQAHGGFSYNNGGQGGFAYAGDIPSFADGGFGGGGTGANSGQSGGGGGGYSGGGGGGNAGGGGGSLNNGTTPTTTGAVNSGEGRVVISW